VVGTRSRSDKEGVALRGGLEPAVHKGHHDPVWFESGARHSVPKSLRARIILKYFAGSLSAHTCSSDLHGELISGPFTPHVFLYYSPKYPPVPDTDPFFTMGIMIRPPQDAPGSATPAILIGLFVAFGGILFG
jgi:hypothetical protein